MSFTETVLYQDRKVTITTDRVKVGYFNTFKMTDIISVSIERREIAKARNLYGDRVRDNLSFLLHLTNTISAGVLSVVLGIIMIVIFPLLGIILVVLGVILIMDWFHPLFRPKAQRVKYVLIIDTTRGSSDALESKDRYYLAKIVKAINVALAVRG